MLIAVCAEVIFADIEVEADNIVAFVLLFTFVVSAAITEARDVEALRISVVLAKAPESRVLSDSLRVAYVHTSAAVIPVPEVRVRVPFDQTSDARVPNDVRVRPDCDHTSAGIVEPRDVEAVNTVEFVLLLIVVTALLICEFVLAFTSVVTLAILAPSDDEACVRDEATDDTLLPIDDEA